MITRALAAACLLSTPALATDPVFEVSFDASVRKEPATGRLVVYLISAASKENANQAPADAPFFDDPQPMFGIDVKDLAPGAKALVDDKAASFPTNLNALPAGEYRVQAVLDMRRDDSSWKREPGNLYSEVMTMRLNEVDAPERPEIKLSRAVAEPKFRSQTGVEEFTIRSRLLSEFRGREVLLKAGIRLPTGYASSTDRKFAAVYEVPGFGGDHRHVGGMPALREAALWITLNPESGNGHTLFADSANNGPCGRALVEELIPALEAKYRLIPEASARVLRGHSSGGWSTLWLALNYPQTFGATWSTSPDPVDFRKFQLVDIYSQANFYNDVTPPQRGGRELPSYRSNGKELMTNRQENLMEEVIGPDNTSGQQWDSWFAVFGPRNENGNPAALFDATGRIDHKVAEQYRTYDIADLVRKDPRKYIPIFQQNVRLLVGDQDNYYLNEAVALLQSEIAKLPASGPTFAYFKILKGCDHGTIFGTPEIGAIQKEILEHFKRNGHVKN